MLWAERFFYAAIKNLSNILILHCARTRKQPRYFRRLKKIYTNLKTLQKEAAGVNPQLSIVKKKGNKICKLLIYKKHIYKYIVFYHEVLFLCYSNVSRESG